MSTTVVRTLRAVTKPQMWAGAITDIERLCKVLGDLQSDLHQEITAEHASTRSQREAEARERWSYLRADELTERWEKHDTETLAKALERASLTLEVKLEDLEDQRSGPAADVLADIPLARKIRSMQFTLSRPGDVEWRNEIATIVTLDRDGAQAIVRGQTESWVHSAKGRCELVLKEQRPWYFFLRKPATYVLVWCLAFFGGLAVSALAPAVGIKVSPAWSYTVTALEFVIYAAVVFRARLFPLFEVTDAGKTPRGRRVIAAALALAAFVLGVVIPYLVPSGS